MKNSQIKRFLGNFDGVKKDIFKLLEGLDSDNYLNMSNQTFKEINTKLKKLSSSERTKIIRLLVKNNIQIKLHMEGYQVKEINDICLQIQKNWNLIIEYNQDVSLNVILEKAKICWERKGDMLSKLMHEKELKDKNASKKISGAFRLISSTLIITTDTTILIHTLEPRAIILSSYWAFLILFNHGVDDFFNLK